MRRNASLMYRLPRESKRTKKKPWTRAAESRFVQFVRHHPMGVPVATISLLLLLSGIVTLFIMRGGAKDNGPAARIVIVSYDHHEETVPSNEKTVGALLKKMEVPLHPGDVVEPAKNTPINQDDFRINIYRAVPVKVVDGSTATYAYTAAKTSRSVATQAGVTLYPEDHLTAALPEDVLRDYNIGETVTVDRSIPVSLNLYGASVPTRTHAKTVKDLLAEKGVKLSRVDTYKPSLDTPITPNMSVAIIRNGIRTITEQHDLAMPVETINDPNLAYGTRAVRQTGSAGRESVTYKINVQNGVEVSREEIQRVVVVPPVPQIVVQGVNLGGIKGDMARAGIAPGDYNYVDYIIGKESGWCPTKWQGEYGSCPAYHGTPSSASVGYGLCQATPGWKMASAGDDWATNPVTQLKWCHGYATGRYGSWGAAYNQWVTYHWW